MKIEKPDYENECQIGIEKKDKKISIFIKKGKKHFQTNFFSSQGKSLKKTVAFRF